MKVLIVPYFKTLPHRQREVDECIMKNALDETIDRIVLLSEVDFTPFGKIEVLRVTDRPTFQHAFYQVSYGEEDIVIVANSDITFEGLENLKFVDWKDTVLALSRHDIKTDGTIKLWNHPDSQDVWIFKGSMKPFFCNFHIGRYGCDNRLAHELLQAGYKLYNPANKIIAKHLHLVRSESGKYSPVPEPYKLVPVCAWYKVPKIKVPKILHIGLEAYPLECVIGRELRRASDYHFINWEKYCKNHAFIDSETKDLFEDECIKWSEWADLVFMQIQTPGIISEELASRMSGKIIDTTKQELSTDILGYTQKRLCDWLRYKSGSSSPEYFNARKGVHGLELQQVPEEYSQLLMWFKKQKFESYLELGVGRGGSFLLNTLFQPNLKSSIAVDNSSYWQGDQSKSIKEKLNWLGDKGISAFFWDMSTDEYFEPIKENTKWDCIFIDADHSYEGVRRDYENAMRHIKKGGYLIFHDIASKSCPGVVRMWNEVKNKNSIEFIHGDNCGIGIVQVTHSIIKKNNAIVIVETRRNKGLKECIENHKKYLPDWKIVVFCSTDNIGEIPEGCEIEILNSNKLDSNEYNTLLTSVKFWNKLNYEKVFIAQVDGFMRRKGIEEFLKYDYIGAAWNWSKEKENHGGNGGESLRTISVMKQICSMYSWNPQEGNEDVFFVNKMRESEIGVLPGIEECKKFGVETIYSENPLCCHAISRYLKKEQINKLKNGVV